MARVAEFAGSYEGLLGPTRVGPEHSSSLVAGMAILDSLGDAKPAGVTELAERFGMNRSTMHRYLTTLKALGYIEQGSGRQYRIGIGVTTLGCSSLASTPLVLQAEESMKTLARRTGFTVSLGALDGVDVVTLYCVRGRLGFGPQLIDRSAESPRWPAYCTALGKMLLANVPPGVGRELLAQLTLKPVTQHTVRSKKALRENLTEIVETDLAICDREFSNDTVMIAAPIRDEAGEVRAGLELAATTAQISIDQLAAGLSPPLVSTADEISARLGYRRPDQRTRVRR